MSKFVTLHGFGGSSGGTELNFEIVGGTTQPMNPKENMIWVNTNAEITGWYFTNTQPSNMTEGEVWFTTSVGSAVPINLFKENNATVYPIDSKQYISGALVSKSIKIYKNNAWIGLSMTLNLEKEKWSVSTDGHVSTSLNYSNGAIDITAKNNDGSAFHAISIHHKDSFDVTNYSEMIVTMQFSGCMGWNGSTPCSYSLYNESNSKTATLNPSSSLSTTKLDIRNVTGKQHFGLYMSMGNAHTGTAKITEIKLL